MLERKRTGFAVALAVVAMLAVTGLVIAGTINSKSNGGGKFASRGVGGLLGSTEAHAVSFNYGFQGVAMPEPERFRGVAKGKVTVKDKDIVHPDLGTVGATYTGDIRCGRRTSQTGISYWGMAKASFGRNAQGPWQYFVVAADAAQDLDPEVAAADNDRFLFILSNIALDTTCPSSPDFFTYHPDEQPRGPAACALDEDGNPNEACRVWDPGTSVFNVGDFVVADPEEVGNFELRMGATPHWGYEAFQRILTEAGGVTEIVMGPIPLGGSVVFDRCRQSGSRSSKTHHMTIERLGIDFNLDPAAGGGAVGVGGDPNDNCVIGPFLELGEYFIDDSTDPGEHGVAKFVVAGEADLGDSDDPEFPPNCTLGNPDACQVERTLTAVWTGGTFGDPGGCNTGLNRCSITHQYVVGGGGKKK